MFTQQSDKEEEKAFVLVKPEFHNEDMLHGGGSCSQQSFLLSDYLISSGRNCITSGGSMCHKRRNNSGATTMKLHRERRLLR
jgi:hypothetical protein